MLTALRKIVYKRLSHAARTGFLSCHCKLRESVQHARAAEEKAPQPSPSQTARKAEGKEAEQGTLRSRRSAVTLMPDFLCLLKGKCVPLLQPRTERCAENQGFGHLTAPADLFSSWQLHRQRNPAAEHGCPFLTDTKSLNAPKSEMPRGSSGRAIGWLLPSCSGPVSST